jgi:hypothetical protein
VATATWLYVDGIGRSSGLMSSTVMASQRLDVHARQSARPRRQDDQNHRQVPHDHLPRAPMTS